PRCPRWRLAPSALAVLPACAPASLLGAVFSLMRPRPPRSTLFPYTTLFRSHLGSGRREPGGHGLQARRRRGPAPVELVQVGPRRDRKSTRLNSSHVKISYAVFCLKKKTALEVTAGWVLP